MPEIGPSPAAAPARRRGAALALAWTLALLLVGWGGCHRPLGSVPVELQGIWRTDGPSHADRFLGITERSIAFGVGGNDALVLGIVGVESEPGGRKETRYVLHTVDAEGEPEEVVLYHHQESPLPSLRLDHEDAVWRPHTRRSGDEP